MYFLEGHLVNVQFKDEWYKNVVCISSDINYLYCMEQDGTALAFNHRWVKQVICGVKKQEAPPEVKPEPRPEPPVGNDADSAGFIPERQSSQFRLSEMRELASNMDFSAPQNMGIIEPRPND